MLPPRTSTTAPTCSCVGETSGWPSTNTVPVTGWALTSWPSTGGGRIGGGGGSTGGAGGGRIATLTLAPALLFPPSGSGTAELADAVAERMPVAVVRAETLTDAEPPAGRSPRLHWTMPPPEQPPEAET